MSVILWNKYADKKHKLMSDTLIEEYESLLTLTELWAVDRKDEILDILLTEKQKSVLETLLTKELNALDGTEKGEERIIDLTTFVQDFMGMVVESVGNKPYLVEYETTAQDPPETPLEWLC